MTHGRITRTALSAVLSASVYAGTAVAQNPSAVQELPAEYELTQGILVTWLPLGPVPDGPITELSPDGIVALNRQSQSEEYSHGHTLKPAYGEAMAEKIKLKKGQGSPNTDGLNLDFYPYHYMMLDLVKGIISSGAMAHIVVEDASFTNQLMQFMEACGYRQLDFNKIVFHYYDPDSIWMRDYGPWVTEDRNRLAVVNNAYYRSRPGDNHFPVFFARMYDLPVTEFTQIDTEGGNILVDRNGRGFTTQVVLASNPGLDVAGAQALYQDVLNLDELVFLPGTLPAEFSEILAALGGTGHVDMGLKLLSDTKVMIGDFFPGSSGKDLLDSWAQWFETHTNPKGEPYEIYRVMGATDGFSPYSYVNAVIINKTVIVPQFGNALGDAAAIAAYEAALPNYKTIGVRSELLPPLAGGLHCITKEIPAGILKAVDLAALMGPGADVADRENHDDLLWVSDRIGEVGLYTFYPDVAKTTPAVMATTLGLSVGKENPENFIVAWPDLSNADYLNPFNNISFYGKLSYEFLLHRFTFDWVLRNALLFPEEPKTAIEQAVYMNSEITVVSIGTSDLAAWNGLSNTPPEMFGETVERILLDNLSAIDPGKKIVLTTPFDYGAILVAIAVYYGQEPSPADLEEDAYAMLYADIIREKVAYANSLGMDVAVADFTELHRGVAFGTVIDGIPLNLGTLPLVVDPVTLSLTEFSAALHAYVVIDAINEHYGSSYPLPHLPSYLP